MRTIEELNAYLKALSLVNSNYKGDFWYCFEIHEIEKHGDFIESLTQYEINSDDYDGYVKGEYELVSLPRGLDQLAPKLNELFSDYLFWAVESVKLDSDVERVEAMRNSLNGSIRDNLLSEVFIDSLKDLVGSDAQVFSIGIKEQENPTCWSVLDVTWGDVYLVWGSKAAYILEVSGSD